MDSDAFVSQVVFMGEENAIGDVENSMTKLKSTFKPS